MTYSVLLHEEAQERLMKLDNSIRSILIKRMSRMKDEPAGRHLKQELDYFVIDVGSTGLSTPATRRSCKK